MIDKNAILPDNITDSASFTLKAMLNEDGWTSTKSHLRHELIQHLQNEQYISFEGCPYRYHITKVGESYLYDVPLYRQGFLKKYRGKRVRIVCVGSGRYKRSYMAGVVGDTPVQLVIKKLEYSYTFPTYATNSEIIYKTRRFLLFKADKSLKILCEKEPKGYVDLQEWDSILIDGRYGLPIAKARQTLNGSVEIRQMGWRGQHQSSDYREAVRYITKQLS